MIEDFELPYGTFKREDPKWVKMRVKATPLPDQFYLCVGFNAEQTKGVYVHYDPAAVIPTRACPARDSRNLPPATG